MRSGWDFGWEAELKDWLKVVVVFAVGGFFLAAGASTFYFVASFLLAR